MNSLSLQEKKVYILLVNTLIIDAINGFLMNILNVQFSLIGIMYRMFILTYFASQYAKRNYTNIFRFSILIIYFSISIGGSYYIYNKSISGFLFDAMEFIRLILSVIIVSSLIDMIKKNIIRKYVLKKIIYQSVKLMFVVYLLSFLLGIGKSTYGDAGYKAVFNANNGLTITLIVLFIFQIEKTLTTKKIKDIQYTVFLLLALLLLGAKSSFIFIIFYFILKLLLERKFKTLIKYVLFFLILVVGLYNIIMVFFENEIISIINRQLYFLNAESESLLTFFLSGRDIFLSSAILSFSNKISIYSILFGLGSYFHQLNTAAILGIYVFKGVEMDLFDIFFSNGLIGIGITYGFFLIIFFKNYKKLINNKKYAEIIAFLSIMIFSITGGHVFTDSMASTYLAIVSALLWENKNSKGEI